MIVPGRKIYPPKTPQQLHDLHQRVVSSDTTLHNKHCLIFYLLKDLSQIHHEPNELSAKFAKDVHIENRFQTFIEGLWELDHLHFANAVDLLTHPSIIPTFPDEILFALLKSKEKLGSVGVQGSPTDDMLPLAYYNCVMPPLEDQKVRNEYARYISARNVTETYCWIQERPDYEQNSLLEILVEQTLEKTAYDSSDTSYTRERESDGVDQSAFYNRGGELYRGIFD